MHLTGIKLGGIPPFTDPITLRFDERVNVFIGQNASGKSTLLTVLDVNLNDDADDERFSNCRGLLVAQDEFGDFEGNQIVFGLAPFEGFDWAEGQEYEEIFRIPAILIGSVREGLPAIGEQENQESFGDTLQEILLGPYSGSRTMCAFEKLLIELRPSDQAAGPNPFRFTTKLSALTEAMERADSCSKYICNEVVRDSELHNYIPGLDPRGYLEHPTADPNNITVLRLKGINTNDVRNFDTLDFWARPAEDAYRESKDSIPIYLGHLSSGTEGTLLWIRWLALQLVYRYDFQEGWENEPAILLIDEIENHLHPTWQRRVIPALLEHFPGLQIFATTHSPFVVAGLKAGQVHVLKRDENGVVTASTNERDVIGWTADEILRGMMGVDDPTDEGTANAARELRRLRNEEPRSNEKEEEERQERMRELREVVNRDLLAGGPLAAQRELFERNLADILEEHRKAQGLNQD